MKIELNTTDRVTLSVLIELRISKVREYLEAYGYDDYYRNELFELKELNEKLGF